MPNRPDDRCDLEHFLEALNKYFSGQPDPASRAIPASQLEAQ